MRHVQDFFIKNPPVENHVKITIAHGTSCAIFNIQNMPFKPQNKILIHHIQQKNTCIKYYIRPWKTSCKTLFQPMRHVQDFFKKKIRPWKSCKKITVAHGTSLAIYNTEACTFRYMMNIMI
jgi:hypothetical protein